MELKNPQWLQMNIGSSVLYGLDQTWYPSYWQRKAGCGPTAAATLLIYLNRRDNGLLPHKGGSVAAATESMVDVWQFVMPGLMGLNSTGKFVEGMEKLAEHYGAPWTCQELRVTKATPLDRVAAFVEAGLASDCPVAFLNLHAGEMTEFDGWHWIVVIGLNVEEGRYAATAYDGGRQIRFDLGRWLATTQKGGGFVYLA